MQHRVEIFHILIDTDSTSLKFIFILIQTVMFLTVNLEMGFLR